MIIERIIFNIVAFTLFLIIFFKMIYKNDSNYIYVLVLQALGIAIGFVGLIFRVNLPIILLIITYIISILIPIVVIIIEKNGLNISEIIAISLAKLYYKKDIEKATNILLKLIEKYPNSYYTHKMLAELYEKKGKLEISADEYTRAIEIKKEDYATHYKIAEILNELDRKDEATVILRNLLKKQPENYKATALLGDILYEQENFKDALSIYLDALQYNPNNYDLYYNLGMVYTRLNDFQSAKEFYEKAAKLNSLLFHAKYDLGQIALLYNENEEAEKYFEECLQDEDLEQEAYYYLGYISMLKGEKETAIQYINIAVEQNYDLYEKAKNEPMFRIINNKINKPTTELNEKKQKKLNTKEIETMLHLAVTCELVENLNQKDLKAMKLIKNKLIKKEKEDRE
jgi:tetratricopeptide (TPR) repeat protein